MTYSVPMRGNGKHFKVTVLLPMANLRLSVPAVLLVAISMEWIAKTCHRTMVEAFWMVCLFAYLRFVLLNKSSIRIPIYFVQVQEVIHECFGRFVISGKYVRLDNEAIL